MYKRTTMTFLYLLETEKGLQNIFYFLKTLCVTGGLVVSTAHKCFFMTTTLYKCI